MNETSFKSGKNGFPGNRIPDHVRAKISKTLMGRFHGKENPNWKGGRWTDEKGYVRIPIKPGSAAYTYEHRLVMEKTIGRKLKAEEVVHHENAIKSDNRPANLRLFKNQSEHVKHEKLKEKNDALLRLTPCVKM